MERYLLIGVLAVTVFLSVFEPQILHQNTSHAVGQIAPSTPVQVNLEHPVRFKLKEYDVEAVAQYHITAEVLHTQNYWFDETAGIMPVDFALGWGPMSDQANLSNIDISQDSHWYHWQIKELPPPIPQQDIQNNSANTHIVPANDGIKSQLGKIHSGEVVQMDGYLINLYKDNGAWHWYTSLSRNDINDGACEVMYVQSVKVIR